MFDVDGVLADFLTGFLTLANDILGRKVEVYGHRESLTWNALGLSKHEEHVLWRSIRASRTFWYDLPLLLEAEAEIAAVAELGTFHSVYFVTARPGLAVATQTAHWLAYKIGVYRPNVIVSSRKGEIAHAIGADFCIDDKAGNAVAVSYLSPETRSFLLDRPYNQLDHAVIGGSVRRVKTVLEYIQEVMA